MKLAYNFKTGLLLLIAGLWVLPGSAHPVCGQTGLTGNKKEFTKTIKKEFDITKDGLTSIANRYGKVYIKTWDRHRVKIDVKITVDAASEELAQEVFDRIKIAFTNTRDMVKAQTEIESKKSSWSWTSWLGGSSKTDYSIDYEVWMPPSGRLDLSNKYGDAYISEIQGQTTLNIKYGNFQAEGIGDNLSLYLGYGKGTVVKARDITAEGSYCQLRVKNAKDINLDTKYSKIRIEQAADISCNTQYDSYKIGVVRDLNNQGKYDNFEIEQADNITFISKYADIYTRRLVNSAEFDLKYGGATIDNLVRGFNFVTLNGSYADYKIDVEDGATYVVDANANYAGIKYPSAMQVVLEKEKGTSHQVSGYIGQKGARSVIKAQLNYGGLKVY